MEEVHVSPDLVYRYQMKDQELGHVLQADLQALEKIHQPFLVNDQLSQLYLDMELEGLSAKLKLEEGITSSSCSSGEDVQSSAPENESVFKVGIKEDSSKLVITRTFNFKFLFLLQELFLSNNICILVDAKCHQNFRYLTHLYIHACVCACVHMCG
jgi:period circadian protein